MGKQKITLDDRNKFRKTSGDREGAAFHRELWLYLFFRISEP